MRILVFYILLSTSLCGFAQTSKDSLYGVWTNTTYSDSLRVKALGDLIYQNYVLRQPDSAIYFARLMYSFSDKRNYQKGRADGINIEGVGYHFKSQYEKAIEKYEQALAIRDSMGDKKAMGSSFFNLGLSHSFLGNYDRARDFYQNGLALVREIGQEEVYPRFINNIGVTYESQGKFTEALNYYSQSIKQNEKLGDTARSAPTYDNIGTIYRNQGEYEKARDYYQRGLDIFYSKDDKRGIAHITGNIGVTYRDQKEYNTALEYFNRALKVAQGIDNTFEIATSYNNMGISFDEQLQDNLAIEYYQKGLVLRQEIGDKQGESKTLIRLAGINKRQNNNYQAIKNCKSALEIAQEVKAIAQQKEACDCLYLAFKQNGNSVRALEYLEYSQQFKDSLNEVDTAKKLQRMEFDKQITADSLKQVQKDIQVANAHKLEVIKKDQNRNIALGAGLFFLLLAGGFYTRSRLIQKSKKSIEKEKQRSDSLLLNILPAQIAEELKIKGSADAQDIEKVTLMFTDFKEFTKASEQLTAQELIAEINVCFKAFDLICEKYKVEKIKTIGDAYMAAGGLPKPFDSSVKQTILAALEMQQFIIKRGEQLKAEGKPFFEMRLGIHTGPVVAGIVGVKKFQYDVWGDTVNTASRLESSGSIGMVNISQTTYDLIKDDPDFVTTFRGKIEVKGKGALKMYFINKSTL